MLAAEIKPVRGKESWSDQAEAKGAVWRSISEPISPFLAEVQLFLEAQLATFEDEVAEGARYALSASGKQLRPVLLGLSAQAAGEPGPAHVTGAAIVELVHLATLVHDDVIDSASVRRQRPTVASRFGNQTAVLLGDCLFAHALKLASSFPTTEVCRIVSGATKAVCSGEILQTLGKGRLDQSLARYLHIIELKTAELFALACELGALLALAPPSRRTALRRFGMAFGTAYQAFDDCLDLYGEETSAGKTLGTDLANGKITLPILLALEQADPSDRAQLERLLSHAQPSSLALLRQYLDRYGAAHRARDLIEGYLTAARESLLPLDGAPGTAALLALTHYLAGQISRLTPP